MELMMFIGNDCIDSIPVDQKFLRFPGYVSHFVRELTKKHAQLLNEINGQPEFLLHGISTNNSEKINWSKDCVQLANTNELRKAV